MQPGQAAYDVRVIAILYREYTYRSRAPQAPSKIGSKRAVINSREATMKRALVALLCACAAAFAVQTAAQQKAPAADVRIPSTPKTVIRGHIPADLPPIMRVKPGQIVSIDTLSHQGLNTGDDPIAFFARGGIKGEDVLKDAVDVYGRVKPPPGMGTHVLTGPVYVEGAEPGDMLEVRVIDVRFRVPYGVNFSSKGVGVLPELLGEPFYRIIRLDTERRVALLTPEIEVPLSPFMGIMAVAPPPDQKVVSSRPPGAFGGNLDLKQLSAGSTLYLPVYNPGALFFTGDAHAAQGDGEVDGTAIETSLTPVLQFFVHKARGKSLKWPRAETATHYISMGIDKDLNLALKHAVQETVDFLMQEKKLDAQTAYAISSIAVDFRVAEAVNLNQMVYGMIPKNLFVKERSSYWYKP
jgi:acetamidase/formamidase